MKKSKNLNPGYVWCPYIMVDNVAKVDASVFLSNKKISSRYSMATINSNFFSVVQTLNEIRKEKIERILDIKNPTE